MLVTLPLKKDLLRDFLNHLFPLINGAYQVSKKHDFGKLLISRVRYSEMPVKKEEGVRLMLPVCRATTTASNHWLYFTKEDQEKLALELEASFNIDFDRYYLQGKKLNLMQKDIIQAYIISRKLCGMTGDIEMLKKREYREAVKLLEIRTNSLLKKANYRNDRIENALLSLNSLKAS